MLHFITSIVIITWCSCAYGGHTHRERGVQRPKLVSIYCCWWKVCFTSVKNVTEVLTITQKVVHSLLLARHLARGSCSRRVLSADTFTVYRIHRLWPIVRRHFISHPIKCINWSHTEEKNPSLPRIFIGPYIKFERNKLFRWRYVGHLLTSFILSNNTLLCPMFSSNHASDVHILIPSHGYP